MVHSSFTSETELKQKLTPEQYHILREKGTEPAFTGKYYHNHEAGTYLCAACGQEVFSSTDKYDSGSGWPSFTKPSNGSAVSEELDDRHGMIRTEITCSRCGSHLGHVFDDGPEPGCQRYCINSAALDFKTQTPQDRK